MPYILLETRYEPSLGQQNADLVSVGMEDHRDTAGKPAAGGRSELCHTVVLADQRQNEQAAQQVGDMPYK